MVNGPLAAEIVSLVWGTPANFNGFRVLAALLHGTRSTCATLQVTAELDILADRSQQTRDARANIFKPTRPSPLDRSIPKPNQAAPPI